MKYFSIILLFSFLFSCLPKEGCECKEACSSKKSKEDCSTKESCSSKKSNCSKSKEACSGKEKKETSKCKECPSHKKLDSTKSHEGFQSIFNGKDLSGWQGNLIGYKVENGVITAQKKCGNIYTTKEYEDYTVKFDFKLDSGANSGIGLRAPLKGNIAYDNFEVQILDDTHEKYAKLEDWQFHGSAYGLVAAKKGYLKPVGEWNSQETTIKGNQLKITLNGTVILDADISKVEQKRSPYGKKDILAVGRNRTKGFFCFAGHGPGVQFKNIFIKEHPKK